jgi:mRNA-degrading endonuclease RelE of RelBE toxin-antitoxin system
LSFPEPIEVIKTEPFNKSIKKNVDAQFHTYIDENLKKLCSPDSNKCDIEFIKSGKLKEKTYRYKFGTWRVFFIMSSDSKQFFLLYIERRQSKTYK